MTVETKTYCRPHPQGGATFLPIQIPVSVMDIEYRDDAKYREFFSKHEIYRLRRANFLKEELTEDIEENDFGTPVEDIAGSDEEELEETESDEKEKEDEKKSVARRSWAQWHETINRAVLSLRKKGFCIAKAQDGTTVYVMIQNAKAENTDFENAVHKEGKSAGFTSKITRIWDAEGIEPHIRINLMLGMLPYSNSDMPDTAYPCDGYEVYVTLLGEKQAKISFARVTMDENMTLTCAHKPYYRRGDWLDDLSEKKRKEQEAHFNYNLSNGFLVRTSDPGDYSDDATWKCRHKRGKISVRSVNPNADVHRRTKHYIIDQAISLFNQAYGEFVQMHRQTWDAVKHWTEIEDKKTSGINGLSVIEERPMETVNAVREQLKKMGTLAVTQEEVSDCPADFENARQNLSNQLHMARYEISGYPKKSNPYTVMEIEGRQCDSAEGIEFTICDIILHCSGKRQFHAERRDNGFLLEIERDEKKTGITVYVRLDANIPLPSSIRLSATVTEGLDISKEKHFTAKYKSGFSLPDIQIYPERSERERTEIKLLPTKEKKQYKVIPQLSVQHFVIPDKWKKDSSENEIVCQRTFYELAIKDAVLAGQYPMYGQIQSAMYIHYVASKKNWDAKTRTMPHYRYFLFDGKDIKELTKEEAEMSDFDVTMYNPDTDRHDIYAVKTKDSTYYIEKTDIIPYGSPEVDAEGATVKPPLRGRTDMTDNLPGYFGISFFETLEAARSFYTDGAFYYCVADARYYSEISLTSGIVRSPHLYKVSYVGEKPRYEDLYDMLSDPIVRSGRYTVKPSIFKYIAEYMRCGGQK